MQPLLGSGVVLVIGQLGSANLIRSLLNYVQLPVQTLCKFGLALVSTIMVASLALWTWSDFSDVHSDAETIDPPPQRDNIEKAARSGRYLFWAVDDRPVAVAAISRRLRHVAAIAPVYTLPEQRGRGYAGSVTAAVADRIFTEGKTATCLYTDLRNPISNRCYAKIGFKPYCESWLYLHV